MEIRDDKNYQQFAMDFVKNVPKDNMEFLIKNFLNKAALNMGCEVDERMVFPVNEIIFTKFAWLPVCYIASAFIKGSLGDYGAGRLNPRTVYGWLNEVSTEYNKNIAHQAQKEKDFKYTDALDLIKYPVGKAIAKKIDWYRSGILSIDDWDKIPIKELAEHIAAGNYCSPELFGIDISKNGQIALRETEAIPDKEEDIFETDNGIFG